MSHDKTIKDIETATGLSYHYILKCIKYLDPLLNEYIERGEKNSLLFSSNAIVVFDQIKQLKQQSKSLASIKKVMEKQLKQVDKTVDDSVKTEKNTVESENFNIVFNRLEKYHTDILNLKDELLESQKRENKELRNQILLLTDGRSPEMVQAEKLRSEQELRDLQKKAEILQIELNNYKNLEQIKVKEIEVAKEKLTTVETELKQSKTTFESKEKDLLNKDLELEKFRKKEEKKNELLKELNSLEGKWFVGSRRKELLKKLEELS